VSILIVERGPPEPWTYEVIGTTEDGESFRIRVSREVDVGDGAEEEAAFKDKLRNYAELVTLSGNWKAKGFSWDSQREAWVMIFDVADVSKLEGL
jgi:hypothetical protein